MNNENNIREYPMMKAKPKLKRDLIDSDGKVLNQMNKLEHLRRKSCCCESCGTENLKEKNLNLLLITSSEFKFSRFKRFKKSSINLSVFGLHFSSS